MPWLLLLLSIPHPTEKIAQVNSTCKNKKSKRTEIPKNTKITTVTDFKESDGDAIEADFEYVVYKTLKEASADESVDEIVYESSTGKFWFDSDGAAGTDYKPVCFAVCVGIPVEA